MLPITNNSAFNTRVRIIHLCPRKHFLQIRKKMSDFDLLVEQYRLGVPVPDTDLRYFDANDRIKWLVDDFNFVRVLQFLRSIADNI